MRPETPRFVSNREIEPANTWSDKFKSDRLLGSRIVTYADDLVILCKRGKADEALQRMREIMGKLKLTVNEEKTRICKVPEGEFDFWVTRLEGGIRRRQGGLESPCGRRRKASGAWLKRSMS